MQLILALTQLVNCFVLVLLILMFLRFLKLLDHLAGTLRDARAIVAPGRNLRKCK